MNLTAIAIGCGLATFACAAYGQGCWRYALPSGALAIECVNNGVAFMPAQAPEPEPAARPAPPPPPEPPLEFVVPAFTIPPMPRTRERPAGLPVPSLNVRREQ